MSDMDLQSLLGSEVFRIFAAQEQAKELEEKRKNEELGKKVIADFELLQMKVNSNAKLKETFKKMQDRFINDPEYRKAADQNFVQGVMLLKIED